MWIPRSNESAPAAQEIGGARRDRTADLNTASVALSQLSYGPGKPRILGDYDTFVHCFFSRFSGYYRGLRKKESNRKWTPITANLRR